MQTPLDSAIKIIVKLADPDKIILLGSRAKGNEDKDSDYDLFILKTNVEHRRKLAKKLYTSL